MGDMCCSGEGGQLADIRPAPPPMLPAAPLRLPLREARGGSPAGKNDRGVNGLICCCADDTRKRGGCSEGRGRPSPMGECAWAEWAACGCGGRPRLSAERSLGEVGAEAKGRAREVDRRWYPTRPADDDEDDDNDAVADA